MQTVPWKALFPDMDMSQMVRDSQGFATHRHYRVKLPLPHSRLAEAQAKLGPYGFVCEAWKSGSFNYSYDCIKAIRDTPLTPAQRAAYVPRERFKYTPPPPPPRMTMDEALTIARQVKDRSQQPNREDLERALLIMAGW